MGSDRVGAHACVCAYVSVECICGFESAGVSERVCVGVEKGHMNETQHTYSTEYRWLAGVNMQANKPTSSHSQ